MKKYKIWLKALMVLVFTCLFIFLIYTDKTNLQLKQPKGELARAEDVFLLVSELCSAGVVPADGAVYEEVMAYLESLCAETADNYINYDLYRAIWQAFLGDAASAEDEKLRALCEEIFYKSKYKDEFQLLKEDWYHSYEAVLQYYDLQEVIREERIEILCTGKEMMGENAPEDGELIDAAGRRYTYLSEAFGALPYTVVKAYVREDRLLVCREVLQDSFRLNNLWLMEAEQEGIRFFFQDYEIFARWNVVPDTPEQYREQVADLVFSNGGVKDYVIKKERIAGKLLRVSEEEAEIEGYGTYRFSAESTGYRLYDNLQEATISDLPVGYDFADFVIEDGEICSFLLLRREEMENIRVLIKNNGFSGRYHEKIEVCCEEEMILTYGPYGTREQEKIPAGKVIVLTGDSEYLEGERLELAPVSGMGRIEVLSLSRSQGTPSYRGKLEVSACEEGLTLINEVLLEEYLYSVVPSEMPASYPAEALKAQAICARTYAYQYLLSPGLGSLGAHVDDSTAYQVYNNITENVNSTKAVKETSGDVLVYGEEPVSTYYYSTSCGYGADEHVWNQEPERELLYLQPVHLAEVPEEGSSEAFTPEELCTEENFREYISGVDENAFEKDEAWYRWSSEVKALDTEILYQGLTERYQVTPDKVLTYTGDIDTVKLAKKEQESEDARSMLLETGNVEAEFVKKQPKEFSEVYAILCIARLPGGVMDELLIVTDGGTYKVVSEYNIRYILNQNCKIIRQDGSVYEGGSLLPSAYLVADVIKKDGRVTGYRLSGGGYGHGAGMSQNGAKSMATAGYDAEEILTFFFRDCRTMAQY
ncbi:MAG: SpoIID/LytB domain-containing protein [Lachnospiraceae bacterium]|nr:SpoIID/LytB domain-containing protein [Lachnospiraceae bacterium]